MLERPVLDKTLKSGDFLEYYYLKEELTAFCRENGIPASGGKSELTERIAYYLDTGDIPRPRAKTAKSRKRAASEITRSGVIEPDFVCSEKHRAFFKREIGEGFHFNVAFQKWLKSNAGKTYEDAIAAYYDIQREGKTGKTGIGRQFEYNAYIRDFFADNAGKTLDDAIMCWKYKKNRKGHNRYERSDLAALRSDQAVSDNQSPEAGIDTDAAKQ